MTKLFSKRRWLWIALLVLAAEMLLPASRFTQPVQGATRQDWNPNSFWHPYWGASGSHKGIE